MAIYAGEVLQGRMPGPYTDSDTERFARLALIDPGVIDKYPDASIDDLTGVPPDQIAAYLADDIQQHDPRTRPRRPRRCTRRHRRQPIR